MDRLRQKYKQAVPIAEEPEGQTDQTAEIDSHEDIEHLMFGLETLPLPQRELLTLYYLEELSIDEVSRVLEIPSGTVKSRLFHARKMLKELLFEKET